MTDYKSTLNLPTTEFPMKANLAAREPDILNHWNAIQLYQKMREQGKKRKKFILHDGPPYANGNIHMGTAVNKTLKDIVTKSKSFSGFDAPFVPGWDCHGLPIELKVEKNVGKPGQKLSVPEFVKACRDFAASQMNLQRESFQRLGVLADWQHPYLTMDFKYEADIIRSLSEMIQQGHLKKGYKPVLWCLDCCSALAEAEVEYADKKSPAIDVRFHVVDEADFLKRFDAVEKSSGKISIPIWTTTPWTLPANQAVALNPNIIYALVEVKDERLLIAESLLENVMQRYGHEKYRVVAKITGEKLEHVKLQHPFYSRAVPVILGMHVTVESGTGAVHTAPAHGQDDFIAAQGYNLPLDNPVDDSGCFTQATEIFAGLHVNKANDKIIEALQSAHTLLHATTITHSYPHCWRHKTPVIFRATPQWFISMEDKALRAHALQAAEKVHWIPGWGQQRFVSMFEKRPDWCISRQRKWGVPIAVFYHKETGELHPNSKKLMEAAAKIIEKEGIEAWDKIDPQSLGVDTALYAKCTDTLDVWFDSGVSHYSVLRQRKDLAYPADLYLEGSDQHRGWFQSSLTTAIAIDNSAPYKTVLTHGYVIDMEGRKMSKSLGNVIVPEKVINSFGADVLRLWVSSIDYRSDIFVSDEILTRISETYRRLRNTARFLLANLAGFDPAKHSVPMKKMLALDRFIVDRAQQLQKEIIDAYEAFQFHLVYQKLHQFCSGDLGSFYLDIIKDRQYTTPTDSLARRSAQTAMFHIAESLVRWMAPILSFTAEEIWKYLPGKRNESVFLNTWYDELFSLSADEKMNTAYWESIRVIRDAVNKEIETQRAAGKIGSALEAEVHLYCDTALKAQLDQLGDELRFVLITSKATVHSSATSQDTIATEIPGLSLQVVATSSVKCERCWHRREDVGADPKHPTLCLRCVVNIEREGETRLFA